MEESDGELRSDRGVWWLVGGLEVTEKWEYGWTRLDMGEERLVDAQIDFFLAEFYKVGEVRHSGGGWSDVGISTLR